jgi:hypothetical protein
MLPLPEIDGFSQPLPWLRVVVIVGVDSVPLPELVMATFSVAGILPHPYDKVLLALTLVGEIEMVGAPKAGVTCKG